MQRRRARGMNRQNFNRREEDWYRVRDILRKYSENSLSYLSLEEDKQWFFASDFEGAASYAVSGHTMIVCGDPVCPDEYFDQMLSEIKVFAGRSKRSLVFLFITGRHLDSYRKLGFGIEKSGEEAVFDVQNWSMAGGKQAKVRSSYHTAVHYGLVVREYKPWVQRDSAVEDQFREITDQWLKGKSTARLQFAVGSLMLEKPCDKRYFYAVEPDGVIQGFNVLNPYDAGKAWIVDIMRRREDCPHGTMELLFHDIMEKLKAEGVQKASLGIAPFFRTSEKTHATLFERGEHYIFEHMNGYYGFRPLEEAKSKFNPVWEDVYIASRPRHMSLWMDEAAFAVLDSAGFQDYVHTFLMLHREGKSAGAK